MAGRALVDKMIRASGLPEDTFIKILANYMEAKGVQIEHLTIENFRELAEELLKQVMTSDKHCH
jgi:hypothetical protein